MSLLLYIDPGSGSIIIQMVIAGGLALSLYFKRVYHKIRFWVKSVNEPDNS
jgi:hypothetical protein